MKKLNLFSDLWSSVAGSQRNDVEFDRRLTVGSPSGFTINWTLKLVSVLVLVLTVGVGNAWGASVTLGPSDTWTGGKSGGGAAMSITKSGISVSMTSGYNTGTQVRYYNGASMTISSSVGNITQIQFTYTNSNITSASPGTWNQSNKKWTGNAASITFGNGGQVRITNIEVTYTAAASYTVTATRNDNSYGTVSVSGTTITATPSTCYQVASGASGYTVTSGTATVSHTGTSNTLTVTPSTNCTVQVNFEKQTVNTYVDEIQGNSDIEDCGTHDAPSLDDEDPASSGSCAQQHWHFMGWVTSANKANPTDANIITPGTEMTANGTTYYAVWAKGTGGGGFDGTNGGTFKIYADVSGTKYYATSTISSGKFGRTTNAADAAEFTIAPVSGGFTIKLGDEYVYYTGSTNLGTQNSSYTWTFASGVKGTWRTNSATSGRGFIYRDGTGFGGYSTGNVTAVGTEYYDLEIGGGYEYSDYMCTCCTNLGSINGSVNLTQTGTSVTVKGWTYTQGSGAAESNISTYDVYLYSDADSYADPIATRTCAYNAKGTGVTFTSLSYGTTYKIKIGATAATNYCDITPVQVTTINSTSTQTFQLACDVPTNVTATSVTASSATVSWDDVATNYQYVLDQSSSDPAGAGTAVNGAHSVNLSVSASTNYYFHVRTNCGNSVFSSWATISFSTPAAACTGYSFHDGTDGSNPSDWQINCFTYSGNSDRQWLKDFTIRNKSHYYVGYQGNFYNDNLGNSNAKSYTNQMQYLQLALDRTHGSNNQLGSNYAGVQGTLLCYDNSSADNLYVDFLPDGYYFILDAAGTPTALEMTCTNPDMTAANILSNNSVWETSIQTITYVDKKYTVGIKANSAIAGKTWQTTRYNTNEDMTTLKKRNSSGGFTGTLAAADVTAGTRGKYRIWADNFSTTAGEKNWYAHFVPYYRVTYNGNGADGSVAASADVSCEGTASQRTVKAAANGFEVPAHTSFGGWATSASGAKVYDPNDDIVLTTDVELFAIWTPEANASITLNNYTGSAAPTNLYAGDSWNLPSTNTYTCGDKTFVGWSTVTVASTDTKPTSNFYEPGASVTLAASNTFYAVFANGGSNDYELVTSASTALAAGDEIIFASSGSAGNAKAMGKKNDNNRSSVDVTIADGGVIEDPTLATSTDNTTDIYPFVLETNGSDFAIKDVLHNQYLTANGAGTSGNNYLRTNDGPASATTQKFTISVDAEGAATITGHNDAANARNNMRYNGSNNPPIFSCYSSGQSPIYIYRKSPTTGYSTTCVACETVTVGYTASPTGGTVGVKKGATSIAPNGTVNVCGATVALTVTLTPATHYDITGFTATGLTTGSATITPTVGSTLPVSSTQDFTVTLSADATGTVTLTPTFTAQTPLTITLSTNSKGTFTTPTEFPIYAGETFTFPDVTPSDPTCATFVGWIAGTTFSGDGSTHDAPVTIAAGSTSDAQNANATYTAVFYETETSESDAYVKVTSTPANWANDHYLIVYEDGGVAFDGSRTDGDGDKIDASSNTVAVSITSSAIAATNALAAAEWKIALISGSNYSIQSASGKYIGNASNSNALSTSSSALANTLSISSGDFEVVSAGGAYLRYNATSGQERFRYYKSSSYSSQQAIQLYKLGTAVVETRTYTTNPSCTPKYRVTVASVTGGSPSANPKFNPEDTEVTLTANPSAGYSFTSWAMENSSSHADATSLLSSSTATTATFSMPAYDVTVTASYAKKMVTELKVMEGETVVSNTTGSVSGTVNISTGANKTLDVVVSPSDAFDHSWTATVTAGGTYASITNVTDDGFRVNGLAQGDATVTVTASNDEAHGGTPKTVTFTVHVTDILPEEIILKRDGSNTPIETLTMYYDASASQGQYVKVNVGYSPANPTNKAFTFSSAATGKVGSHSHAPASGYEVLVANGVTTDPVNCTFTSAADGSVTKVLAVTVLPILTDTFVDYIHGNATQYASARLSTDRYTIVTEINTPSLSDASDANPTSEDCETSHYHLIGWLPKSTAEALWAAGTAITEATEGLVRAGAEVDATGQVWYAIWAKEQ